MNPLIQPPGGRRIATVAAGALVVALLLTSVVADYLLLLFSGLQGFPEPVRWLAMAHQLLILIGLVTLGWQWRRRPAWLFALGIALLPWMALAAVMLPGAART